MRCPDTISVLSRNRVCLSIRAEDAFYLKESVLKGNAMSTSVRAEYGDLDIQQRVTHFLATRHFPGFQDLEVSVEDGFVTVSGHLDSFYAKQVALNTCQRVAGVVQLVDGITVE